MRTQDEIVSRITESQAKASLFNFESDVLIDALDFEHAKPYLKEGTTAEQWNVEREADGYGRKLRFPLLREEDLKAAASDYLKFAWSKAQDHKGLSASRSVDKMTAFCWLLGHDVQKIEEAEYAQYGCPQLKVVAELLGEPLPTDSDLLRMMDGQPCYDGCESGCGS